jgi:hypothetical protein
VSIRSLRPPSCQNPGNSRGVQTFFRKQYFCVTKTGRAFPLFPLRPRKSVTEKPDKRQPPLPAKDISQNIGARDLRLLLVFCAIQSAAGIQYNNLLLTFKRGMMMSLLLVALLATLLSAGALTNSEYRPSCYAGNKSCIAISSGGVNLIFRRRILISIPHPYCHPPSVSPSLIRI